MNILFAAISGVALWLTVVLTWRARQSRTEKRERHSKLLVHAEL